MRSDASLTSFYYEPAILRSTPAVILIITVLYVLLGKIGFLIPTDSVIVCPIYLPAGLSLASTIILGKRALLGIWIGSFLVNLFFSFNVANMHSSHLWFHILIGFIVAFGNTIAAFVSSILIKRTSRGLHPFHSGETILILLVLGSISYAFISSVIGTVSLTLCNSISKVQVLDTFQTWWLGDIIGIVLVVPFILSCLSTKSSNKKVFNPLEFVSFGIITIFLCYGVFFQQYGLKYLFLPLLFWSVNRFGTKITSFIILIIAAFAIIATINGIGPFIIDSVTNSILFLDLFLCVISICSLFLATIITERQRAKNRTKISENQLQNSLTILESIIESPKEVSIYSLNKNYEYLNFNSLHKKNIKLLNNVDICLGMTLQESLISEAEIKDAIAVLDRVFLGESITTIRQFDFDHSYWEFRTSPIVDINNEIIGATVISTNISQKIKIEKALKKSEKKYREIFTNVQDVIFQMDLNSVFLDVSPSIKEFVGYTPEELIGQHTQIIEIDGYDANLINEMVKTNTSLINHEKEIKTKSGEIKTISVSAKLIYDKHGNPSHIDAIARDITEKKANEEKIALQNQKLLIQNKELEQFAYITSHDLQEPLLTLNYFTELLITNGYQKDNQEEVQQYLNFILKSSDRMQKLVKGLLDYSRIGKQMVISKEDCNQIVQSAINSISDRIQTEKAKITIGELPIVNGYSVELIELFKNLIENAIVFRRKIPLEINISAKQVDANWQFAIEDNGIGMEQQNTEKIFIIFKRLNNREEYPGIGISLAICKKIIALHNGDIWAESLLGQGTTIYFTLPVN